MADTVRTINTLLTALFEDAQPNDAISAQDMRDLIVSLAAAQNLNFSSIPTSLPGSSGVLWNNGGILCIS